MKRKGGGRGWKGSQKINATVFGLIENLEKNDPVRGSPGNREYFSRRDLHKVPLVRHKQRELININPRQFLRFRKRQKDPENLFIKDGD